MIRPDWNHNRCWARPYGWLLPNDGWKPYLDHSFKPILSTNTAIGTCQKVQLFCSVWFWLFGSKEFMGLHIVSLNTLIWCFDDNMIIIWSYDYMMTIWSYDHMMTIWSSYDHMIIWWQYDDHMVILILIIISSSWQLMGAAAALFLKTNDYPLIGVIATCEILLSDTQHETNTF